MPDLARPRVLACNLKFCPRCRIRRQMGLFNRLRPKVLDLIGDGGAAFRFALSGPHHGPLNRRIRVMFDLLASFWRTQTWRRRSGLSRRVGVIWAFELSPGADGAGHPHFHLMVFARESAALDAYCKGLFGHWASGIPGFNIAAVEVQTLSSAPESWGPRLKYILKGPDLAPDWPVAVFEAAVMEFTSGRQHIRCIGLLSPRGGGSRAKV